VGKKGKHEYLSFKAKEEGKYQNEGRGISYQLPAHPNIYVTVL
jgi:hypothetical protein